MQKLCDLKMLLVTLNNRLPYIKKSQHRTAVRSPHPHREDNMPAVCVTAAASLSFSSKS